MLPVPRVKFRRFKVLSSIVTGAVFFNFSGIAISASRIEFKASPEITLFF